MSTRVDTASLIPGAIVCGNRGLGVLGSTILLTTSGGTDGNGVLYNDVEPGDEAKEFRALIVTPPTEGELYMDEDGTFTYAGGDDTFDYQLIVDGQIIGSPARVTLYEQAVVAPVTVQGLSSNLGQIASGAAVFPAILVQGQGSNLGQASSDGVLTITPLVQGQPGALGSSVPDAVLLPAVLVQGNPSTLTTTSTDATLEPAILVNGAPGALGSTVTGVEILTIEQLAVWIYGAPGVLGRSSNDARLYLKAESRAVYTAEYDSEGYSAARFTKQPRETRRIDLSFRRHLQTAGDEPVNLNPAEVDIESGASIAAWLHQDGVVTVWVAGGLDGRNYAGSATLKTVGGEALELDCVVRVRET